MSKYVNRRRADVGYTVIQPGDIELVGDWPIFSWNVVSPENAQSSDDLTSNQNPDLVMEQYISEATWVHRVYELQDGQAALIYQHEGGWGVEGKPRCYVDQSPSPITPESSRLTIAR